MRPGDIMVVTSDVGCLLRDDEHRNSSIRLHPGAIVLLVSSPVPSNGAAGWSGLNITPKLVEVLTAHGMRGWVLVAALGQLSGVTQ